MKIIRFLLFVAVASIAGSALAQQLPTPTNLVAVADTAFDYASVTLRWYESNGAQYQYQITRYDYSTYNGRGHVDTTTLGPNGIVNNTYTDFHVYACDSYTYFVRAVLFDGDQIKETSLPSDSVQITAHASSNAVIIYPILPVYPVPGTLFSDTLYACDVYDNQLNFSLATGGPFGGSKSMPSGLSVTPYNTNECILKWNVPVDTSCPYGIGNVYVRAQEKVNASIGYNLPLFNIKVYHKGGGSVMGEININGDTGATVLMNIVNTKTFETRTLSITKGGALQFEGLDTGTYKLYFNPLRYPESQFWYPFGNSYDSAQAISIASGQTVNLYTIPVTVQKHSTITVSGTLSDLSGAAIANASIQAIEVENFFQNQGSAANHIFANAPSIYSAGYAISASDGSYSIQVDSGRSYLLLATASGHQAQFIGKQDTTKIALPFNAPVIAPGGNVSSLNGNLPGADTSGQQIVGTVFNESNAGVQALILLMEESKSSSPITSHNSGGIVPFNAVSSNQQGIFSISNFTPDTNMQYIIQAVPYTGYNPSYYGYGGNSGVTLLGDSLMQNILWENAQPFTVSPNSGSPVQVNMSVTPMLQGAGVISGNVTEMTSEGSLIPSLHAFVYAINDSLSSIAGYAITDGGGNFVIGNLPMGKYTLVADKFAFVFDASSDNIILSSRSNEKDSESLILSQVTSVRETGGDGASPARIGIQQNYPNPFSNSTAINVSVPYGINPNTVSLDVYDALGRTVADLSGEIRATLRNDNAIAIFTPHNLPNGAYYCRLRDGAGNVATKQILLMH